MKKYLFVFLLIIIPNLVKGTAQAPDYIIYKGDTIPLFSNPLEDYYNEANPRPKSFGIRGCWSTACWRGYQATWLIENDSLYLVRIGGCCGDRHWFGEENMNKLKESLPEKVFEKLKGLNEKIIGEYSLKSTLRDYLKKKEVEQYFPLIMKATWVDDHADLKALFPELYKDGKVKASWFTGVLSVPKGKLLEYVHMGYMSTYENELIFEIIDGVVIEINQFSNTVRRIPEGYNKLNATAYSMALPPSLNPSGNMYYYAESDTISLTDTDNSLSIECLSMFNKKRLLPDQRLSKINSTIDSLKMNHVGTKFEEITSDKNRWGIYGYLDGYNENNGEFVRIYTMVNINMQMIFILRSRKSFEHFYRMAQDISQSVRLMEFSY